MESSFVKDLISYSGVERKSLVKKKEKPVVRRAKNPSSSLKDKDYDPNNDDEERGDATYIPGSYQNSSTRAPPVFTMATTTPLVRHVFEFFFKNQLANEDKKNKPGGDGDDDYDGDGGEKACGICKNCLRQDCGTCTTCKSKAIFGGDGMGKNEICLNRICLAVEIMEVPIIHDDQHSSNLKKLKENVIVEFVGKPLQTDQKTRKAYYASAKVSDTTYLIGDCVMIRPDILGTACFIARVLYFLEEAKEKIAHVQYFCHGSDTVLGELGDRKELFALDDCEDVQLFELRHKVNVSYWPIPDDWFSQGGTEEAVASAPVSDDQFSFWFRQKYDSKCARFTKVDYEVEFSTEYDPNRIGECRLCKILDAASFQPVPQPRLPVKSTNNDKATQFEAFVMHGERFCVGDSAFISPSAFKMPYEMPKLGTDPPKNQIEVDIDLFTEYYRHKGHVKGSNEQTPDPFRIGFIERIAQKNRTGELAICVRKMYRPENTAQGEKEKLTLHSNINEVFWSDDLEVVPASMVEGKCIVRPKQLLSVDPAIWHDEGSFRFYFEKMYDSKKELVLDLPQDVIQRYSSAARYPESEGAHPAIERPLKTLDVFAGCGGLSLGLEMAGIAKSVWVIENFSPAASAFKLNHPDSIVITADCNLVLQQVLDGQTVNRDQQSLPMKGQVELLCGGPPCQGFSMMNSFNEREYSQFKNSLISTYLSYCDYYRPKFFILENVKNFASYKKNLVLKLCLRALVMMGYQCTFGVLQAGNYGVPQTRRRCILMAAAPDQTLPTYPEPKHVFAKTSLNVVVVSRAQLIQLIIVKLIIDMYKQMWE
jgi:DNA (cytosine-5)-methyltransferase 1